MDALKPLRGKSILLVEDEPIISLDLCGVLRDAGADVVTARTTYGARKLIDRRCFSAALLDIHLGGRDDCAPTCEQLTQQNIPFAFYTANPHVGVVDRWPRAPLLRKPARAEVIIAVLSRISGSEKVAA